MKSQNGSRQVNIPLPNLSVPGWIRDGRLKFYLFTAVVVGLCVFTMWKIMPANFDVPGHLSEIASWMFRASALTVVAMFVTGLVLVTLMTLFDPLTIRRELMHVLVQWYKRKRDGVDDPGDGLYVLSMAITASSTFIGIAIIVATVFNSAF